MLDLFSTAEPATVRPRQDRLEAHQQKLQEAAGSNPASRISAVKRKVIAGCYCCAGSDAKWVSDAVGAIGAEPFRAKWVGEDAEAEAAEHHRQTGHPTWSDTTISVRYGGE